MNITSILLFIILLLVVGADFLFTKLRKKNNADVLKLESKREVKETKKTLIKNKKIQFVIVFVIWVLLLIFDIYDSTIDKPLIYNYNELFIVVLVVLFYIVFSINASLKINNLDSKKNKAREIVFTFFSLILSVMIFYINMLSIDANQEKIEKFESLKSEVISTYYGDGKEKDIVLVNENNFEAIEEFDLDIINEKYYENKFYLISSKFKIEEGSIMGFKSSDTPTKTVNYPTLTESQYNSFVRNNNNLFSEFQSILGKLDKFLPRSGFSKINYMDYEGILNYNNTQTNLSGVIFYRYHFNTIKINSITPRYRYSSDYKVYYHSNYIGPYEDWYGTGSYYYSNRFRKYFWKNDVDGYRFDEYELDLQKDKTTRTLSFYNISVDIIENPLPKKYLKLPKAVRLENVDELIDQFDIDNKMFNKFYEIKNVQAISKNYSTTNYYKPLNKFYRNSIEYDYFFNNKINYISNSVQWEIEEIIDENFITNNYNVLGFILSFLIVVYAFRISILILIRVSMKLFQGLRWSFKTYFE